jgi:hypothetical protein
MGAAQRVAAFAPFDPTMPDRETMGETLFEMIERFVLVEPPGPARHLVGAATSGEGS